MCISHSQVFHVKTDTQFICVCAVLFYECLPFLAVNFFFLRHSLESECYQTETNNDGINWGRIQSTDKDNITLILAEIEQHEYLCENYN